MCYYVSTRVKRALKNDYKDGFHLADESEVFAGYEVPDLPVTFQSETDIYLPRQWGLIPAWAKDVLLAQKLQKSGRVARAETIFKKTMFRDAALHRRCLIWLDGFFDFELCDKKKIPYLIQLPGRNLFPVAGISSAWQDSRTGVIVETCALVTTAPNELMKRFNPPNPRLPLILPESAQQELWLDAGANQGDLEMLLRPLPDGLLVAKEKDPRANMVKKETKKPPQLKLF